MKIYRLTINFHGKVLGLDRLIVFYPGERAYPLEERIKVLTLAHLAAEEPII
jgi:hypothetical protein